MLEHFSDLNQFSTDQYDGGKDIDTLKIHALAQIAVLDWFNNAISDYQQHIINNSSGIFDFSIYDLNKQYLQFSAVNFEKLELNIIGDIINNTMPRNISVSSDHFSESNNAGDIIATLSSINDAGETPSYLLLDDSEGRFKIDELTGEIKLSENFSPDFEQDPHLYQIEIRVDDNNGYYVDIIHEFKLNDVNESPWNINLNNNVVMENVENVFVGLVTSSNDTGEVASYRIVQDESDLFQIDSLTGELTVKPGLALDFESAKANTITIEINDNNGFTVLKDFTIHVENELEVPSHIELSHPSVIEHLAVGQTVAVVDSGLRYDLSAFNDRYVGGYSGSGENHDPIVTTSNQIHGTLVSTILASDHYHASGWAPNVDIAAVQISSGAIILGQNIYKGFQWLAENIETFKNPLTTINMSFDGGCVLF